MAVPVVDGSVSQQLSSTSSATSLSRTTANAGTGDVVVVVIFADTTNPTWTPSATFATLVPQTAVSTRRFIIYARVVEAGDATSYTFTPSVSAGRAATMIAISGSGITTQADLATIPVVGTVGLRAVTGTSTTNVAAGSALTTVDNLIVTASVESTSTADTVGPSWSNATAIAWSDDTFTAETTAWGYATQAGTGTPANVTITYQNTNASNGAAVQIAFPATQPVAATGGRRGVGDWGRGGYGDWGR